MLEKDGVNILEPAYGIHSLVIYRAPGVLRDFFINYIPKETQEKNEVIEFLPFYETENTIRTVLSNSDLEIDVDTIEKRDKTLILHDSL